MVAAMSKVLHAILFAIAYLIFVAATHAQQPHTAGAGPSYRIAGQWHWRADCGIGGAWHGSFQFEEPSNNQFKGLVTANVAEPGTAAHIGACPTPIKIRNGKLRGGEVSFVKESCGGARAQPWKGTISRGRDNLLHMSGTAIADSSHIIPVVRDWYCTWTASQSTPETAGVPAQEQPAAGSAAAPTVAENSAGSPQPQAAAATGAAGIYALDDEITFNVLDHVEIDRQTGKLILMGHSEPAYATPRIPYLQYLAALLDNPSPQFSLEWAGASQARVADLRRLLASDAEWKKLAGEWGRWIDDSEHITPAGRVFMPQLGIPVPDGTHMDRYQVLTGVFRAIGEQQAAGILAAFAAMHRGMPNPTEEQVLGLFRAAGVFEILQDASAEHQAGRITETQMKVRVYRALFASFDRAMNYAGSPTETAFDNALRRGVSADAAMGAAISEFDRQFEHVYGNALARLYQSKSELQVPITMVNPSWRGAINVEPKYIGVNSSSLLAKLLLEADRTSKALVNSPELAGKIPAYQTQYAYRMRRGLLRGANRVSTSRLWTSVDSVEASQSTDGDILAFGEVKMRFNLRELGQDDRDLPGQQPGEYEKLLTSLYDDFARHYSPVFHELREAAKLAFAAQWLKARRPDFQLPAAGRSKWTGPASVPGVIFITWSPDPAKPDVQSVSAIGGVSLRVPPPGPGVCVKFCEDQIPKSDRIKSISALVASGVARAIQAAKSAAQSAADKAAAYVSDFHTPWETYANATTVPAPALIPPTALQKRPKVEAQTKTKEKEEEEEECLRFHEVKVGFKKGGEPEILREAVWDNAAAKVGKAQRKSSGKFENLCGIVWHFLTNPDTEDCGPDDDLLKLLGQPLCTPSFPIFVHHGYVVKTEKGEKYVDPGRDGEYMMKRIVESQTGQVAETEVEFTLLGFGDRTVDVVGHEKLTQRAANLSCMLHCVPARPKPKQ
jgi:hypothetical protein